MQKKLIYILDDEIDICHLLEQMLCQHGYQTDCFQTGARFSHALKRRRPDLCIIDLGLPDMDGTAIVRQLHEEHRIGLIIISGRDSPSDRVLGLEYGADDYLSKPFDPRELVARVNSLCRRLQQIETAGQHSDHRLALFADWQYDPNTLILEHRVRGNRQELSVSEANLLNTLLQAPRQILSRDQLLHSQADSFDRSIDVRMSRIRKKIEADPRHPSIIKTVYGAGYMLTCEVQWLEKYPCDRG